MEILLQTPKARDGRSTPSFGQWLWHGTKYFATALLSPVWMKNPEKKAGEKWWKYALRHLSFKKLRIGIFLAAYYVIQPLSLFLFPKAEDVLKQEGLDPGIVANVTSYKDIRVTTNDLGGTLYGLTSYYPFGLGNKIYDEVIKDRVAKILHRPSPKTIGLYSPLGTGGILKLFAPEVTSVFVKNYRHEFDKKYEKIANQVDATSRGLFSFLPPITGNDRYARTLIHEIRHTDPKNRALPDLYCEADADYHAIKEIARSRNDSSWIQAMITSKLIEGVPSEDHNTALYLCMRFNDMALPDEQEMRKANKEAEPILELFDKIKDCSLAFEAPLDSLNKLKKEFNEKMKPYAPDSLTYKRVAIYVAAWRNCLAIKSLPFFQRP